MIQHCINPKEFFKRAAGGGAGGGGGGGGRGRDSNWLYLYQHVQENKGTKNDVYY